MTDPDLRVCSAMFRAMITRSAVICTPKGPTHYLAAEYISDHRQIQNPTQVGT